MIEVSKISWHTHTVRVQEIISATTLTCLKRKYIMGEHRPHSLSHVRYSHGVSVGAKKTKLHSMRSFLELGFAASFCAFWLMFFLSIFTSIGHPKSVTSSMHFTSSLLKVIAPILFIMNNIITLCFPLMHNLHHFSLVPKTKHKTVGIFFRIQFLLTTLRFVWHRTTACFLLLGSFLAKVDN